MTYDDYVEYCLDLVAASKIEVRDPDKHVKRAIAAGLAEFWGASNWWFRAKEYSLALSSSAESYDLPEDFDGFRTIREQGTSMGMRLQYLPKEEFDRVLPKLSTTSTGDPQAFTIYMDATTDKKKIRFYPKPAGTETLYISYFVNNPDTADMGRVPSKFHRALEACIAKHVYPPGSPGRAACVQEAAFEINKCEALNKVDLSDFTRFLDSNSQQVNSDYLWWIKQP